ncbi:hypothetical protein [Rhodopseudomonas sp. B29]|uniref:hypothetical protein n=1 Tax=Rhodopseudomonas sp. B29 TaxID=95607 RepID=UPI0003B5DC29|nr:hypothetical protein [Rhodopseudomonas sp. B29]
MRPDLGRLDAEGLQVGSAVTAMPSARSFGGEVAMKVMRAALMMSVLAGPAFAQEGPHVNLIPEIEHRTPEQKEQDAIRQRAYQDSLRKIPDPKVSSDPWGSVRASDAPAPAAKKPHVKPKAHAAN